MTDNDIIKALVCCIKHTECPKCPMKGTRNCMSELNKNALDLINRQQAEVERLEKENERVKSDWTSQKYLVERMQQGHSAYVEQAKSEAIKEFAERLENGLGDAFLRENKCVTIIVDNLVKEMTEQSVNDGSSKKE